MRAATIDPVFIPSPRVHERLDEKSEGAALVQLELLQQMSERLRFTAAFRQVAELITHLVAQKSLHLREVDEVTDRADAERRLEQVTDRRAVRIATGERREIFEA